MTTKTIDAEKVRLMADFMEEVTTDQYESNGLAILALREVEKRRKANRKGVKSNG